jgi:hypothetical protein
VGGVIATHDVIRTAVGEVPVKRVRRYFRDDEWMQAKMGFEMQSTLEGLGHFEALPRGCSAVRACSRAQNIADLLAEVDWRGR